MGQSDKLFDYICSGIVSGRIRSEVRQELADHFEDTRERNLAVGMSEEEAEAQALKSFGDPDVLRSRMSDLHSHCSIVRMSSALSFLFWGFLLASFNLNIFNLQYVSAIYGLIKNLLIFSALFRLRKCNKNLLTALFAYSSSAVLSTLYECVTRAFNSVTAVNIVFIVLICLSTVIWYWCLFTGLQKLFNTYAPDDTVKKARFTLPIIGYTVLMALLGTVWVSSAEYAAQNVTLEGVIFALPVIALAAYTLVQIRRVKRALWDADGEYSIEERTPKYATAIVCFAAFLFILPLCSMYIGARPNFDETPLVTADLQSPELAQKADEIRAHMIELGLPSEIAEDLPDSEIMRYDGATYMQSCSHDAFSSVSTGYCFYIPEYIPEIGKISFAPVRILTCVEPKGKSNYCMRLQIPPMGNRKSGIIIPSTNTQFISSVYTKLGKKYTGNIIETKNINIDRSLEPKAAEIARSEDMQEERIYYAEGGQIQSSETEFFSMGLGCIFRKTWFDYNRADILSSVYSDNGIIVDSGKYTDEQDNPYFSFENYYSETRTETEQETEVLL